jgi:hypothetical protein
MSKVNILIKKFYFSLFLMAAIASQGFSKEVSGQLGAGEGSSFIPMQGSAFSITRDVTSGIYGGNYDVTIKNNSKVFYQEQNQKDDLYLVFNEPVDDGDIIKIEVNKGLFQFKMSHMESLPEVVVDAIKAQVPNQYEEMTPLHKPRKSASSINPQNIQKAEPLKEVLPKVEEKIEKPAAPIAVETPIAESQAQIDKKEGFFENFSKRLNNIFSPAEGEVSKQADSTSVQKKSTPEKMQVPMDLNIKEINDQVAKPKSSTSTLANISSSLDASKIQTPQTTQLNDQNIKSGIESAAEQSIEQVPAMGTSNIDNLQTAETFSPVLDKELAPTGALNRVPSEVGAGQTFAKSSLPSMQSDDQINQRSFETKIDAESASRPAFSSSENDLEIKEIKIKEEIPQFQSHTVSQPQISEFKEPSITQAPVLKQTPKVIEQEKPVIQKESASKDKIIITKTIAPTEEPRVIKRHVEPSEYQSSTSNIPERMSDRVLGGGYADNAKGTLSVKAYSNRKAVSAWVEVFKAGTKQRVKTFYTGKGRSLKDIKLPAGVYVVKATYRTSSMKRQKSLGKITLSEGGSINKSISFDDGSLLVRVKKFGEPLYAKVELFRSGSKRRIAYEFTSRSTGVAKFHVATGLYDIVIKDHNNVQKFDNIKIRSAKTRTLNADF